MKKVAVIVDGANLIYKIRGYWSPEQRGRTPSAKSLLEFIHSALKEDEELFRIFYYDCLPFSGKVETPISRDRKDFGETDVYKVRMSLLDEIRVMSSVAFRKGEIKFRGWRLKRGVLDAVRDRRRDLEKQPLNDDDFAPNFEQKGVDMKIGLDIAWLASQRIVDKILLFGSDTDFVPALKFARTQGILIVVADMGGLHDSLREHADEVRKIDPAIFSQLHLFE